ncbi:hypothetical protein J5N97_027166 [Dioscorea zingiberensis]|uniref:Wound-responsive family protein n=1 Tax=Dioscorea zingiberensis TaxID=325984 RepID=A0A9D5C4E1_9LILI|nr:hypothetical protein J5N97_027166 [Dioscorea zingiberensis]
MGCANRASWIVAANMGAVEALKDQGGLCRWNYAFRSLHQHAKSHLGSLSLATRISETKTQDDTIMKKHSEESLRKVMYLSCWGPN